MRGLEYLQRRRGCWCVRLRVPAHLVPHVGQTHLVRSLETKDEVIAQQRRWVALAELWRWIGNQTVSDGWSPAWAAHLTDLNGAHGSQSGISNLDLSHSNVGSPNKPRSRSARSSPNSDPTVASIMERWLKEMEREHTRQTIAQHRAAIGSGVKGAY